MNTEELEKALQAKLNYQTNGSSRTVRIDNGKTLVVFEDDVSSYHEHSISIKDTDTVESLVEKVTHRQFDEELDKHTYSWAD